VGARVPGSCSEPRSRSASFSPRLWTGGATPTPATENAGVGQAAKRVAEHARSLARLELELAQLELKRKAVSLGLGAGLGVAAAIFGLIALGFGLAAAAAALALTVATWLALLIVFGALLLLAGLLGLLGLGRIRRGTPPIPKQAIEEARITTETLKSNGA
jgi:putative superfamily III holin-X